VFDSAGTSYISNLSWSFVWSLFSTCFKHVRPIPARYDSTLLLVSYLLQTLCHLASPLSQEGRRRRLHGDPSKISSVSPACFTLTAVVFRRYMALEFVLYLRKKVRTSSRHSQGSRPQDTSSEKWRLVHVVMCYFSYSERHQHTFHSLAVTLRCPTSDKDPPRTHANSVLPPRPTSLPIPTLTSYTFLSPFGGRLLPQPTFQGQHPATSYCRSTPTQTLP
jgi:hypothetical protein